MPSNHLILCRPLLLLPSILPSIRGFSNESALCIRWPKYWSCSFKISPTNEHPGLISFKMDWLDLLAVQGTLKSLLQHHRSKASILWCSAFFIPGLKGPPLPIELPAHRAPGLRPSPAHPTSRVPSPHLQSPRPPGPHRLPQRWLAGAWGHTAGRGPKRSWVRARQDWEGGRWDPLSGVNGQGP